MDSVADRGKKGAEAVRLRARVDGNQKAIVSILRTCGCKVMHLHQLGHGKPDILCGYRERLYLFEIKDPAKCKSQRALTPAEAEFHSIWQEYVWVIETAEQAMKIMGVNIEGAQPQSCTSGADL